MTVLSLQTNAFREPVKSNFFSLENTRKTLFYWINATKHAYSLSKEQETLLKAIFDKFFQSIFNPGSNLEDAKAKFLKAVSKKFQTENLRAYVFLLERALSTISQHHEVVAVVDVLEGELEERAREVMQNVFVDALTLDKRDIRRFFRKSVTKLNGSLLTSSVSFKLKNTFDLALDKIAEEDLDKKWFQTFRSGTQLPEEQQKQILKQTKNAVYFGFMLNKRHVRLAPKSESQMMVGSLGIIDPSPIIRQPLGGPSQPKPAARPQEFRPDFASFQNSQESMSRSFRNTEINFSDEECFEVVTVLKATGESACMITVIDRNQAADVICNSELLLRTNYFRCAEKIARKPASDPNTHVLHNPKVTLFRDSKKNAYSFIEPVEIDLITISGAENDNQMKERVMKALRGAAAKKYDALVFDKVEPNEKFTKIVKDLLNEQEFKNHFTRVTFANQTS